MKLITHAPVKPSFVPSIYQQNLFDWGSDHAGGFDAAVVQAVAGSGKSRSLRELSKLVQHKYNRILVLSFDKNTAMAGKAKFKEEGIAADVRTYHSFGYSGIRKQYPGTKFDEGGTKVEVIVKGKMQGNNKYFMLPSIKRLTSLCKGGVITNPDNGLLYNLATDYDIELYDDQPDLAGEIFDYVRYAISKSIDTVDTIIDFDDMIFLPVALGLQPDQYDLILGDEFQDTNHAQSALIQMGRVGNLIGVGDENQSIYAFRGADSQAMQKLITQFNADELPLSICYRCPKAVGDLIRKEFPSIPFETPDWAIEGSVSENDLSKSLEGMQDGDMVVSRINANLPSIAFALIRQGKTARIMGRDIGKSLKAMIEKQKAYDLPDLFSKLQEYREHQMDKFMRLNKPEKITQLDDQIETISALSEGANNIWDVMTRCQTMFSDEKVGICCGTIHKWKGGEAKNVYITRPDLIPLPFVMQKGSAESKQQEMNMKYVSYSRSQENLIFCHGDL